MRRTVSLSIEKEYQTALEKGYVRKCIGSKCVCWEICRRSKKQAPECMFDLSSGFYHEFTK